MGLQSKNYSAPLLEIRRLASCDPISGSLSLENMLQFVHDTLMLPLFAITAVPVR
jgi:hypothetical protein